VTPAGVRAFIGWLEGGQSPSQQQQQQQPQPQQPQEENGAAAVATAHPPIGWVTSFVGGHANLITVTERPQALTLSEQPGTSSTRDLGLAGRIAQRRKERRLESSRERQSAAAGPAPGSGSGGGVGEWRARYAGSSLNLKRAHINTKAEQATIDSARSKLDAPSALKERAEALRVKASTLSQKSGEVASTLASRVGRQLHLDSSDTVEPSKLEALINLWDRDRNGEISKGEVRIRRSRPVHSSLTSYAALVAPIESSPRLTRAGVCAVRLCRAAASVP
jgi:hypothetical protein